MAPIPVVLEMINKKCLPILLFELEACPLSKSDKSSLEFILNRLMMKMFNTGNMDVVNDCAYYFHIEPISVRLSRNATKFMRRFSASENIYCQVSAGLACND